MKRTTTTTKTVFGSCLSAGLKALPTMRRLPVRSLRDVRREPGLVEGKVRPFGTWCVASPARGHESSGCSSDSKPYGAQLVR